MYTYTHTQEYDRAETGQIEFADFAELMGQKMADRDPLEVRERERMCEREREGKKE
jgi:hypothetical protein